MNIIYASDDNYAIPCMVSILSILRNNNPEECSIYILSLGLNEKNTALLKKVQSLYPQSTISVVELSTEKIKGAIVSDRFPIAIFFRFLIPDLFDFDKALYLDCDTIVNGNIEELWQVNMDNMACGMVEDQVSDDITQHNRIRTYTSYYNSGVMMMNLDYWRKEKLCEQLMKYVIQHPERCLYPDQDAINATLADKIVPLDYKFNFQERWYEAQKYWLMHRDKWSQIEKAKKNPVILHYTGPKKPWMAGCTHPLAKLYFKYKADLIMDGKSIEDDQLRTQQKQARMADEIARKKRHKHIRRANLFTILFLIETIAIIAYFFFR